MTKKEVIVPADDLVCLGKDKLQELIRCKDCARGATCFTYRETGDGDGFCKWAERRPKTP